MILEFFKFYIQLLTNSMKSLMALNFYLQKFLIHFLMFMSKNCKLNFGQMNFFSTLSLFCPRTLCNMFHLILGKTNRYMETTWMICKKDRYGFGLGGFCCSTCTHQLRWRLGSSQKEFLTIWKTHHLFPIPSWRHKSSLASYFSSGTNRWQIFQKGNPIIWWYH